MNTRAVNAVPVLKKVDHSNPASVFIRAEGNRIYPEFLHRIIFLQYLYLMHAGNDCRRSSACLIILHPVTGLSVRVLQMSIYSIGRYPHAHPGYEIADLAR
jgi:hypothetical protein